MILAVSMEGLHFERFLNENYFDDKEATLEEPEAYTNTDQKKISEKTKSFIDNYEEFQRQLYQDYMEKQQGIEWFTFTIINYTCYYIMQWK